MSIKKLILRSLFILASLGFAFAAQADKHKMATQEMLSHTCVSCHGPSGHSAGPAIPSIGGQTKNYLIVSLLGYKFYGKPDELDAVMKRKEFEDFEVYLRYSTIMNRLMKGYTVDEIIAIADYFSSFKWQSAQPQQKVNMGMAKTGKKLHKKFCEKCHVDGGASTEDDISILTGQWMPFVDYTMRDYAEGKSKMPKKMKTKMDKLMEKHNQEGVQALVDFYGHTK